MSEYIKSPLNFTGGKYKLLPQILPLFPDKIERFVDVFGGGFNVGINVEADEIIYNDNCVQLAELMASLAKYDVQKLLRYIDTMIEAYDLSKGNKDGYLKFRDFYNNSQHKSAIDLYILICYAFNNQFRFNTSGEFNVPFGYRQFNQSNRERMIKFCNALQSKTVCTTCFDFKNLFKYSSVIDERNFYYCDPPYLNAVATYNENGKWTADDEKDLHSCLDEVNANGLKFALSNNLKYDNLYLKEWMKKYNVHYLNADYSNCSYQKKDRSVDCEVLITNY